MVTLIKNKVNIILCLLLITSCSNKELTTRFNEIWGCIITENSLKLKELCTDTGWTALEYNFGNLSEIDNLNKMKLYVAEWYNKSAIYKSYTIRRKDTISWFTSPVSSIELIKVENDWLLNDFRMKK